MHTPSDCPKCQGKMSEGVIADLGHGQWRVASFIPGAPTVSKWFGLKVRRKDLVPTQTYRCSRCGFLESYAPPV